MLPKTKGKEIQLLVIQPFTKIVSKPLLIKKKKVKDEWGKILKTETEKFVKENYLKVWYPRDDIGAYGQFVGTKGQIVKSRTLMYIKSSASYIKVAHSLLEMEQVMQGIDRQEVGFKK